MSTSTLIRLSSLIHPYNDESLVTKTTVPLPTGGTGEGEEIQVKESTERWSEFRLEDGTLLRMRMTVLSAVRVDGHFDAEGNPLYLAKAQAITSSSEVPRKLKKKG